MTQHMNGFPAFLELCEEAKISLDFGRALQSNEEWADYLIERIERFGGTPPTQAAAIATVHAWRNRPQPAGITVGRIRL